MKSKAVIMACLIAAIGALPVSAQDTRPQREGRLPQEEHSIEIFGYGGYLWSDAIDAYYDPLYGTVDIKSGGIWGIEADITIRRGGQLVLLYSRQDTELLFDREAGFEDLAGDVAVEYWHIGGMGTFQRGSITPYTMFTLGGTRIIPEFEGAAGDEWKFSVLLGVGAKVYLNERVGIRVQGRVPWILMEGGGAVACGSGSCYTMMRGWGVVQADVSGGLFIMF